MILQDSNAKENILVTMKRIALSVIIYSVITASRLFVNRLANVLDERTVLAYRGDPGKALPRRDRGNEPPYSVYPRIERPINGGGGRGGDRRFDIAVWCNSPRGWTVTGLFLRLLLAITLKTATSCGRGNRAAWGIVPHLISLPSLRSSHNIRKNVGIPFLRGNVNYYWRNNSSSLTLNCDILSNLTRNILFPSTLSQNWKRVRLSLEHL